MRWLHRWRLRLRSLLRRRRVDDELDAELQFYLDHLTNENLASGLNAVEAGADARRSLGSVIRVKEAVRDTRGVIWFDQLTQDLSSAVRMLSRNRTFSFVVVLILALGIGVNTAVFSLVNTVLLRPLPVGRPEQLMLVAVSPGPGTFSSTWNYRVWDQIRQRPHLFDGTLAYQATNFNLAAGGERDLVDGLRASGSFFDTLGISARLGRTFTVADDQRGGGPSGPVAVISYRLWQRRFAGAEDVIGRPLTIGGARFSIVGVLPQGFLGPVVGRSSDVVTPLGMAPASFFDNPGIGWLTIMARLKPGHTADAATAALRTVQSEIRDGARTPDRDTAFSQALRHPIALLSAAAGNPLSPLRMQSERPLWTLLIIVAVVLLIACGNVGHLMLARALARQPEMSVRAALGGSQRRLACQLLVESSVLGSLGATAGWLLAQWSTSALAQVWATGPDGVALDLTPDGRVLLFTFTVTIMTVLISGTLPAVRASRVEPIVALKNRGQSAGGSRMGLASWLVAAQVAGSLVLVLGAGLFVRTFANLVSLDLGFDPRGVLVADVSLANAAIAPSNRLAMFEEIRRAVSAIPGVEGAAMADLTPVDGGAMAGEVIVSGGVPLAPGQGETFFNRVSPGWLSVYKIPLLAGRDFTDADRPGGRRVAIVNAAFARKFLNGANPIGRIVRNASSPLDGPAIEFEIVGMTADAVYDSLRGPVPPTQYAQFFQLEPELISVAAPDASLSIRSSAGSLQSLRPRVADAIVRVNSRVAFSFQPLPDVVNRSIVLERALAIGSAFFGGLALLLAGIGLYGVTSYAVNRRRHEIGVRVALGATPQRVVRLVFARVTSLVAIGLVIGTAAAVWLSRFVGPLLFGVQRNDPATLAAAVLILAAVGALAGWLPASRASRLDPMEVLRDN